MKLPDGVLATTARQLGRPNGPLGRVVGRLLNRGNRTVVAAAVEAARPTPGCVVADVGFGGGIGLSLLLDRVGTTGVVHGIEISDTMLTQARRRFRGELDDGRLQLHNATMDRLPLADASVDAMVSTNTIYFVRDLDAGLTDIARVLRPPGRLALGVGDPEAMARMPFTRHGFELRPISDVIDHLTRAGFSLVEDRRVGEDARASHVIIAEIPPS
jgi:arsenite methyltransferase